ncbi:MAG TPA: 16S rRNA (guanine(527)-N(7))-methyltransferase RsmG [Bacteroides sp.]|nr:16S rRNA (guanine(527)-N(7))-methyltransferase RsmG [Bacteroides sp.]
MDLIRKYFPDLEHAQDLQFRQLLALIPELNRKVNVISRKDIPHLEERHILHSLAIAKTFSFHPGCSVVDLGTGGGFPGIPLSVIFPRVQFLLVDSIGKKVKIVRELIHALGLKNASARQSRVENLDRTFDYAVSRAVTSFSRLSQWSRKLLVPGEKGSPPNGMIILKGGDLENELGRFRDRVEIIPVSLLFDEPFFSTKKIVYLKK